MIENGRFFYENQKRLINEFVDGRVRIYMLETGMRLTQIQFAGTTITVAREKIPQIIPGDYGSIVIESKEQRKRLLIKKPVEELPIFVVEDKDLLLGSVQGNRLDLALAYNLGVKDQELEIDKLDTYIDPKIPEKVTQIVFQINFSSY